ncbi:hypothetical protein [Streptomyces sp. NPDC060031]|uniref:hypothetical protein n=1 Tax=Streptomyces sp. NPDC060031 TaxID=3347043 RepID=UPI0036CD3294
MAVYLVVAVALVFSHPRAAPTVPLLALLAAALGTICSPLVLRLLRRRRRES